MGRRTFTLSPGQRRHLPGHDDTWGAGWWREQAELLYDELKAKGARIHHPPRNYPWSLEMHVEDLDGNVLRMGSDPKEDQPYEDWEV
jgi:hypothetical protein